MLFRSGVTAVGYGLLFIYGILLMAYTGVLVASSLSQDKTMLSHIFSGQLTGIGELRFYVLILWILYLPQVAGLTAVLRLKEWGRRLVVVMHAAVALLIIFFFKKVAVFYGADFVLTVIVLNALVIAFFSWAKIKGQFEAPPKSFKKKILVVDDDRGFLKMLQVMLASGGFCVLTAATGEQGLKVARRKNPDLIVLDVILPGIKGREVCTRLKQDENTKDIPVIFLTSKNSPDDIEAELQAGGIAHLSKPLDSQRLFTEINRVLFKS